MTPKEAFKGLCDLSRVDNEDFKMWLGLKGNVEQALNDYEDLKINNERQFEAWQKCKTQKHECGVKLRDLKKDIKRYFELLDTRIANYGLNDDEIRELIELEHKLKGA